MMPTRNGYQHLPGVIPGREPTIILDRVSKWYGDIVAVSDVTFGVTPGVTALLGPNGAGKSTTLKMITGLLSPSTGRISILGKPARGNRRLPRVGLVHEAEHIYPYLTGREFVRMNAILQRFRISSRRSTGRSRWSRCATRRTGRSAATPRACASGSRSRRRWCTTRT